MERSGKALGQQGGLSRMEEEEWPGFHWSSAVVRETFPMGRYLLARCVAGHKFLRGREVKWPSRQQWSQGFPKGRCCPSGHLLEWYACNNLGGEAWSRLFEC